MSAKTEPRDGDGTRNPAGAGDTSDQVRYDGRLSAVAGIAIRNALLNIPTLGVYRCWGATRVRRYLWSHLSFRGSAAGYRGTPGHLARGLAVAIAVLAAVFAGFALLDRAAAGGSDLAADLVTAAYLATLYFLVHLALYSGRGYRLVSTYWDGWRGGQSGSATTYALAALGWIVLVILSAGLAHPYRSFYLHRYRVGHSWLGNQRFHCDGDARDLMPRWLLAWLLLIPSLGLSYFWYRAQEVRHLAALIHWNGIGFESDLTGWRLARAMLPWAAASLAVILAGGFALSAIGTAAFRDGVVASAASDAAALGGAVRAAGELSVLAVVVVTLAALGLVRVLLYLHPLAAVLAETTRIVGEMPQSTASDAPLAPAEEPPPAPE